MPPPRPASGQPSLAVAVLWLTLAASAIIMFLGGIHFLTGTEPDPLPAPTHTVTVTATPAEPPGPPSSPDDALTAVPDVCADAHDRGVVPRDRWTPCGQLLGYFDDWATPPPGAPAFPH